MQVLKTPSPARQQADVDDKCTECTDCEALRPADVCIDLDAEVQQGINWLTKGPAAPPLPPVPVKELESSLFRRTPRDDEVQGCRTEPLCSPIEREQLATANRQASSSLEKEKGKRIFVTRKVFAVGVEGAEGA